MDRVPYTLRLERNLIAEIDALAAERGEAKADIHRAALRVGLAVLRAELST